MANRLFCGLLLLTLFRCSPSDEAPGNGGFVACNPAGDWLVTKLVVDLDKNGMIDAYPAGTLTDDVVQFNSDGTGFYIDNFSNSTGLVTFNWSCNVTSGVFELFGTPFNIDEDIEKSLKLSRYDGDLGTLLEVHLHQP
jgi:hypothetical protein